MITSSCYSTLFEPSSKIKQCSNKVYIPSKIALLSDTIAFCEKQDQKVKEENNKKSSGFPINRMAAGLNLTGGLALMLSVFFPKIHLMDTNKPDNLLVNDNTIPVELKLNTVQSNIDEVINTPDSKLIISQDPKDAKNITVQVEKLPDAPTEEEKTIINTFKQTVTDLEKGDLNTGNIAAILLALGMLTGSFGQVKLGSKTNQPTEILSGAGFAGCAALMASGNFNAAFGAIYVLVGFFFSGLANNLENLENPDNMPVNYDLTKLKDPANWKKASTDKKLAREMFSELMNMFKFVGNDQVKILKASKNALTQTWEKTTGKRKEFPDIITLKPSGDQCRVSAAVMYLSGLMMLASMELLGGFAFGLISTANIAENCRLIAMGKEEKDWGKPALISAGIAKQLSEILLIAFPESNLFKGSLMASLAGPAELSQRIEDKDQQIEPVEKTIEQ